MNKKFLHKLIIDPIFNIYNRNGLEYIISKYRNKYLYVYLVDFDNVKELNEILGYSYVNDIFKNIFNELKNDFIIGRAFSGDEIFFFTDNINVDFNIIKNVCIKYNMIFEFIQTNIYIDNDITEKLNNMLDLLHNKNLANINLRLINKYSLNRLN